MVKSIMEVVMLRLGFEGQVTETWIGYGWPLKNGTKWANVKENEQNVHSVVV